MHNEQIAAASAVRRVLNGATLPVALADAGESAVNRAFVQELAYGTLRHWGRLSALAQVGLPLDKLQTYSADISAVTPEQAATAAKTYYDPAKATVIVVGDAQVFWNGVKGKRAGFERLGVDQLNLDSATLK